jgi:threonine/homoserine/homoserine lactone efflux protein
MGNTFLQVLPLALGGAVNLFGIIIIFFLLASKDRPLTRTWLFLLGSTIFLILVVIVEHALLSYTLGHARHETSTSAIIDIVLGVILVLLAILRNKKQKSKTEKKAKTEKISSMWHQPVVGFFFMAVDFSTLVLFFAAVKMVFDAKLAFVQNTIIFAAVIIIVMSTMALPPFLATIMPHKSARALEAFNLFVTKHVQLISKIVIIVIAIYLMYKGIVFF